MSSNKAPTPKHSKKRNARFARKSSEALFAIADRGSLGSACARYHLEKRKVKHVDHD